MRCSDGITDSMDVSLSKLHYLGDNGGLKSVGSQKVRQDLMTEQRTKNGM